MSMIELSGVECVELNKGEIEKIAQDCDDLELYEKVHSGVSSGRMFAFKSEGGLFVLMPIIYQGSRYISIIVVVSNNGKCFTDMLSFAKDRAREIDAEGMFFSTANKRLHKVSSRLGWIYRGKRGDVYDWLISLRG